MNELKIKDLLKRTRVFRNLADEYEDENILSVNESIYDTILDELNIDANINVREDYYAIFEGYDLGLNDENKVINELQLLKSEGS